MENPRSGLHFVRKANHAQGRKVVRRKVSLMVLDNFFSKTQVTTKRMSYGSLMFR